MAHNLNILKAIKSILVNDNTDVSATELCIHSYVGDKIYKSGVVAQPSALLPYITIDVIINNNDLSLNLNRLESEVSMFVFYGQEQSDAILKSNNCGWRVSALLDRQIGTLNKVVADDIRFRLFDFVKFIELFDEKNKIIYVKVIFNAIIDIV